MSERKINDPPTRAPSPEYSPRDLERLSDARDRRPHESDLDVLVRHMLADERIEGDQKLGWDRWWVAGEQPPSDGQTDSGDDGMRDDLMATVDPGRAIRSQHRKPPG